MPCAPERWRCAAARGAGQSQASQVPMQAPSVGGGGKPLRDPAPSCGEPPGGAPRGGAGSRMPRSGRLAARRATAAPTRQGRRCAPPAACSPARRQAGTCSPAPCNPEARAPVEMLSSRQRQALLAPCLCLAAPAASALAPTRPAWHPPTNGQALQVPDQGRAEGGAPQSRKCAYKT